MTLIRKLALVLFLGLLCSRYSNSQTIDPTTGNLINYGTSATDTTSTWNNGVYVNQLCFQAGQAGNCGPNPSVRPGGNINFSYGQVDLNQVVNINRALAAGGNGVQLSGFNFGFTAKNGNGWDNGQQDYLAAYVKLYGNSGLMANYDYTSQTNRKYNWTNFNFSETFANPVAAANYTNAQVGFVGRDTNFWAGNYGPEIYNVSFSLKYRVDPCATNIAYSPNCAGFNTVTTGSNIFNSSVWSNALTQSVAINTALKNSGIGAIVHGVNYGFDYTLGQSWSGCTATNQDGSCSWYMNIPAQVNATARLTNSDAQTIFSKSYALTGDGTSGSVSGKYLLPTSLNQTGVGRFSLTGSTSGTGSSIGNFSASLIYTADPCVSNPLYNASCTGYAVAYAKNMLLGSTVASASAPAVAAPAAAQSAPAESAPAMAQASPQQQAQQPAQQAPQQQSAQDPNQNPSMAQDNPSQPNPTQAGPAPTSPQPAGGPPQTATASAPQQSSGPQQGGSSGGPSKLAMSVVKTAQANDKATQQMAVQNAAKAFEATMQSSNAASNAAVSMNQDMSANSATAAAQFSSQTTQASIQASVQSSQGPQQQNATQQQQTTKVVQQVQQQQEVQQQVQQSTSVVQVQQATVTSQQQETQSTSVVMLKPPVQVASESQQQSSGTGLTVNRNPFAYNPLASFTLANLSSPVAQTSPVYQPRIEARSVDDETPTMQVASFGGMGKAGNPLSEMLMQQRFELMQNNVQQQSSTVNKNVQPNDLAGGVDLASMATTPVGFNAYSFMLKDAAFYEPKEVYKNQKTVDNVQVLRQLSSDSLHKQMVDMQYK